MNIDNITSDKMGLSINGMQMQIKVYEKEIERLNNIITNLQNKLNQYEDPDDLTLFYMWLDEKAKDKMKELEDNLYSANQIVNELLDIKEKNEKAIENIDLVIELIKQQPTGDDTWILNKLNGFKYLLQGEDKE